MPNSDYILRIQSISKSYHSNDGNAIVALRDITFNVKRGGIVSIVGPSGCGKTTLLKIIAHLCLPSSGIVQISEVGSNFGPDIMLVFQEYNRSLFPWRTVFKNVAFGIENIGMGKNEIRERVLKYLRIVKLSDFADKYPWQLSGGMQQRVAIARALACEPRLLLMDEPFGSLDALSRSALEDDLLKLFEELDLTIVFVTHDIDEAIYISDEVVCLSPRPSDVVEIVTINLPRPRHQIQTKNTAQFWNYRAHLNLLLGRDLNEKRSTN